MKKRDLKKLLCALLACCLLFSLAACGGDTSGNDGGNTGTPSNEVNTPSGEVNTPAGAPESDAGTPETPAVTEPEPTEEALPTLPPTYAESKGLVFQSVEGVHEWGGSATTAVTTSTMLSRDFVMNWRQIEVINTTAGNEGDGRIRYQINMYADPGLAVEDGGFSLTYELFDLYTGVVMATSMNVGDENGSQVSSGAYTIEYNGNTYDIAIDLSSSLSYSSFSLRYSITMPEGYDGLGIVLAYSNMAMEEAYEHLRGTNATLDDYGIFDRLDYKFFRVSDFFAEG